MLKPSETVPSEALGPARLWQEAGATEAPAAHPVGPGVDRQAAATASAGAMARAHSSRAHWILGSATSGRSPNTSAARA